jgi:hypothetical protein
MLRVRPSSRPWSSSYREPLIHAIQIRAKTTANSASPPYSRDVPSVREVVVSAGGCRRQMLY